MNRTDKETFVIDFREKIGQAPVIYFTDFTGLDVKSMTDLRRNLRDSGAEYLVVKNRLVKRAFEDSEIPDITDSLLGPTGVVFGYGGVVEPAKIIKDFAKAHDDKPVFKIGILDNKVVSADEIIRLAGLPPREQLLAELAGALEAPMVVIASALESKIQEMSGLFDALRNLKENEEDKAEEIVTAAEEVEAEAEETEEVEAEEAEETEEAEEVEAEAEEAEEDNGSEKNEEK